MDNALTVNKNQITFTDDQVTLIKKQIAPKATNDELQLFLYQAKRTGLDPLARQIYCIHRKSKDFNGQWVEKMTVQTSIDGFRVIAERSGDYGGQSEPDFVEQDGKLVACKITVFRFRGDIRYPAAVGVAYWNEYVQTDREGRPMSMWAKMPHTMLSKVAEALALRKAYPQDLSGLYTNDEMQQADNQAAPANGQPAPENGNFDDLRSVDELHIEYMELFNGYVLRSGDPEKARAFHPDNWRKERTQVNYIKAIEALRKRLETLPIEA